MEEVIKTLKEDIRKAEEICSRLKLTDTEYFFWNGARTQASVTLKQLEKLNKK